MLTKSDIDLIQGLLDEQTERLNNNIIEFKDQILSEIVKLRDDVTVITGYRDMLEDHEQRISRLEAPVKTP